MNNNGLTPKEKVVLELLAEGNSFKMVANKTGSCEQTAKNHARNIRYKLNAYNSTHSVAIAIRLGLIL